MRRVKARDGFSYEPFDRTRSIFVHVPKCAGISISRALYGNLGGGHTTFNEYATIFEPHAFRRYFKFAICPQSLGPACFCLPFPQDGRNE